jgi:hypothetical protein
MQTNLQTISKSKIKGNQKYQRNIKEISKKYQRNIKEISKKYQRNIKKLH